MILFKEDWAKYPEAIVDTKTKNESFLRIAAIYKKMGIENHAFMLQLHNPKLQGIDPHDPNLTPEQILMIADEVNSNYWYYIREVVRVPGGTDENPIRYRAHRGNIAMAWLFFNHVTQIIEQIRQTGKSFGVIGLTRWLTDFRCYKTQINLLTKDDTLRAATLDTAKEIREALPFYLRMNRRDDVHNTEEYSIKRLGNKFLAHLPSQSPKTALNVGRGLTSPIFWIDEFAFLYNIGISLGAALAAGTAARDRAIMMGDPYGTIITTTSGKKDDRDGKFAYDLKCRSAIFTEKVYDCKDAKELELVIRKATPKGDFRVTAAFNHQQLGYDDDWLVAAIERAEVTGEAAERDFGNRWTSGSLSSPLSVALSATVRDSERKDFFNDICKPVGYIMRWFIPEDQIDTYMNTNFCTIGLDTSDAAGQDDIFLVIRDIKNGAVVGAANINETNLLLFAQFILDLLTRFEKTLLVPERRSSAVAIIDYLLLMMPSRGLDPFKRIYNRIVQEADEDPARFNEIKKNLEFRNPEIYTKYKKTFGFATSGTGIASRTELYGTTFQQAAKLTGDRVHDPRVIDQMLSLVISNGRVDHGPGEHDDGVIAWLLSFWILVKGKKLEYYGINSKDILTDNAEHMKDNNPNAVYHRALQLRLKNDIEDLVEDIRTQKDDMVIGRLEARLIHLNSKLTASDQAILSVDNLIHKLREERKARWKFNRR